MLKLAAALAVAAFAAGVGLAAATRDDAPAQAAACESPYSPVQGRLDLSRRSGRRAPFLRTFDHELLYLALGVDSIRAIDRPCHEPPERAERALLPPSALVLGVELNGEERAYPVDLLAVHEIVNDVVGGKAIALTYCPLCSTGLAYERRVGGRTLTFGVSGYLYQANLVLFDRETGSLWSQLLGGAVTGRMRGHELRTVPIAQTTWRDWLRAHPETLVLSIRRDPLAERFTKPYSYSTAMGIEESNIPYGTYATKVGARFRRPVRGVAEGSFVLGVSLRGKAKAYPILGLERRGLVEDELAGVPLLVVPHENALSGSAFSRRVRGRTLSFRRAGPDLVDLETGTRWSAVSGRAQSGPLEGAEVRRVRATPVYWFAWRRFFPGTAVWRG